MTLPCPHCNCNGFKPGLVDLNTRYIRDYTMDKVNPNNARIDTCSPLKIGDSFDNLKRKMIPLEGTSKVTPIAYEANGHTPEAGSNIMSHVHTIHEGDEEHSSNLPRTPVMIPMQLNFQPNDINTNSNPNSNSSTNMHSAMNVQTSYDSPAAYTSYSIQQYIDSVLEQAVTNQAI